MALKPFLQACATAFSVIAASEVGDKTFFIAAVMAMKSSRLVVFSGCTGALVVMTILSSALGAMTPHLIPRVYMHWATIALFIVFGVLALREGFAKKSEDGANAELEEVEAELGTGSPILPLHNDSSGAALLGAYPSAATPPRSPTHSVLSTASKAAASSVFTKAFVMTFLAEWGDRSQIATAGLAAEGNVLGVILGGSLGHAVCTGVAVLGGKQLALVIDERTVNVIAGVIYLGFAGVTWFEGVKGGF